MDKGLFHKIVIVFVALVVISWLSVFLATGGFIFHHHARPFAATWPFYFISLFGLLGIFIHVGLGLFVYHDAKGRGMEPVLWALVAAFVPYFIGFVVYLIVRGRRQVACPSCGQLSREASYCPNCGHPLRTTCAKCRGAILNGARFCPHCGAAVSAAPSRPEA
ncbi:MAG: zinc ribbon domain-containing protein [Candidatus Eisenbacteria bacterium]